MLQPLLPVSFERTDERFASLEASRAVLRWLRDFDYFEYDPTMDLTEG